MKLSMEINGYLDGFHAALQDEVAAVRQGEGTKCYLTDGRCLGQHQAAYLYSFNCDAELHIPDDAPVDVEYQGRKQEGNVQSIDGFDVVLALPEHIGDSPGFVTLYTAPWFLLQELDKRLQEVADDTGRHRLIVRMLSDQTATAGSPAVREAQALLSRLSPPPPCNRLQGEAVAHLLTNEVTYLWGPPGTGKTNTLALTAAALALAGNTVLVTAHSNVAVDVAMVKVAALLEATGVYAEGRVLRYGVSHLPEVEQYSRLTTPRGILKSDRPALVQSIERLEEERRSLMRTSRQDLTPSQQRDVKERLSALRDELMGLRAELKEEEERLVRQAIIVGCTLCKATMSHAVHERRFDAVLVDEASMAYIPQCAFAASLARDHVGIYGDFRQLPPIAMAESAPAKKWLQRDAFDESGIISRADQGKRDPRMVMLQVQYRMHPQISAIPNRLSYRNLLLDAPSAVANSLPIAGAPPSAGCAVVSYDLAGANAICLREEQSHSRFNLHSALAAVSLACSIGGNYRVGIATPYNAQSRLIHRLLQDAKVPADAVQVSTVHRFQGSERDIIIFDTVDVQPQKVGLPLQGGSDSGARRLLNVAISRAKGKFILLADQGYLRDRAGGAIALKSFLREIAATARYEPFNWPDPRQPLPGLQIAGGATVTGAVVGDMLNASEEVTIIWPDCPATFVGSMSRVVSERVRCFIAGRGQRRFHGPLKNTLFWHVPERFPWGLVAIDRKVLWLWEDPTDTSARVLRMAMPTAVGLLYAFLQLVPEREANQDTIEQRFEEGKSAVGPPCPQCRGLLWPKTGRYGVYLACTSEGCAYTKKMTPQDATSWARLNGILCPECDGPMVGRRGPSGLFWGCANYPRCRGTRSIESTI